MTKNPNNFRGRSYAVGTGRFRGFPAVTIDRRELRSPDFTTPQNTDPSAVIEYNDAVNGYDRNGNVHRAA